MLKTNFIVGSSLLLILSPTFPCVLLRVTLLRLRFPFLQFPGAFLGKLAQKVVANYARVLAVAFFMHSFVCLSVTLFNPRPLLGPKRLLRRRVEALE
jgi:hypothetical protein